MCVCVRRTVCDAVCVGVCVHVFIRICILYNSIISHCCIGNNYDKYNI